MSTIKFEDCPQCKHLGDDRFCYYCEFGECFEPDENELDFEDDLYEAA